MPEKTTNLQSRLDNLKIRLQSIGELKPVLSEQDINHFETLNGITLPLEYREFLLQIGNGFSGILGLNELPDETEDCMHDIAINQVEIPFTFEDNWIWDYESDEESEETEEKNHSIYSGNLLVMKFDYFGTDWHLIVNGPAKGQMWNFSECGIQAWMRRGFLDWVDYLLSEQNDWWADYDKYYADGQWIGMDGSHPLILKFSPD